LAGLKIFRAMLAIFGKKLYLAAAINSTPFFVLLLSPALPGAEKRVCCQRMFLPDVSLLEQSGGHANE